MFFLKHATVSSFLNSIGVLFYSLVAETAKERPPSVSLLYLGQTEEKEENEKKEEHLHVLLGKVVKSAYS